MSSVRESSEEAILGTVVGQRILLVDDSALVRSVVVHALTQEGLSVTAIADPHDLADAMTRERPDLLLVDATFPGIDHAALAALVKPHAGACPVVVFSDRPAGELETLVTQMGARGALPKDSADGLGRKLQAFF